MRGARRVAVAIALAAVLAAAAAPAHACEVCYGAAKDSPLVNAARTGVFLLLAVTLAVQGGFVAFFLHLWRRAKRVHEAEIDSEWSDLQRRSPQP